MANIVRGFRRAGWVVTVPVAAFIVLVGFESTKEFSPMDYEVKSGGLDVDALAKKYGGTIKSEDSFVPAPETVIEIPGLGYAHFPMNVPSDVTTKVISHFSVTHSNRAKPPESTRVDETGKPMKRAGQSIYTVQGPKSQILRIEAPSGTSEKEVLAHANLFFGDRRPGYSDIPEGFHVVDDNGTHQPIEKWQFTVYKKVNKLKLAGLILGALAIPALFIQGGISVFAWVIRGFTNS